MGIFSRFGSKSRQAQPDQPAGLDSVRAVVQAAGYTVTSEEKDRFVINNGDVPVLVVEAEDAVSIGSMVEISQGPATNFDEACEWAAEFNLHNVAPTMFAQDVAISGVECTVLNGEYRILRRIDYTHAQLTNMVTFAIDAVAVGLAQYLGDPAE